MLAAIVLLNYKLQITNYKLQIFNFYPNPAIL
jgi:hypothetical protein